MEYNETLKRIQFFLDYNHWTLYKLAKVSGISYSSLNNLFQRNNSPTISTLEKICAGFQISLGEFFDYTENPLRSPSLTDEQQELLNAFDTLSIHNKQLLKAYLQGLSQK